ncbi:RNA helicase [Paenibacillus sp. USDA918EY]|uniref:RNA helicase n=1 Tax=Paenibacillus sp. USDA918EY TaxID=2689575 RepID=UPI00135C9E29|nr:RNA helicase [Paenibacillus sp. USDA918EY]
MTEEKKLLTVGLVMPIAPIDGCSAEHWLDVKRIISESLASIPNYQTSSKIVSEGDSTGLIHKRIVEGLYASDIVICDVSCKNPNVMFELGMRLAFDKPTVIIKDDQTGYSFDTGVIEHLQYPRDLRYKDIVDFKEQLAEKVKATYEESMNDPSHSPFLKSFGTFKVAKINETIVPSEQLIIESLNDLQNDISMIKTVLNSKFKLPANNQSNSNNLNKLVTKSLKSFMDSYALTHGKNPLPPIALNDLVDFVHTDLSKQGIAVSKDRVERIVDGIVDDNNLEYRE